MKSEIWKPVKEFEGKYEVSNYGRIKSFSRKEIILKPAVDKDGYLFVRLYNNKIYKTFKVHRLVANTFIPNPNNYPQINHINEDKTDNRVDNLEWCTANYNINYGNRTRKSAMSKSKPVIQYSKEGVIIMEWLSCSEVERELGYSHQNIGRCCLGKGKLAYGYIWKYKN